MRFRPVMEWKALAALVFAAALFAGTLSAAPQENSQQSYSKARVVRLSFVQGDVQLSRPEEDDWERALANMPLQEGYAIATGRGRAEIEFESGATVRLADGTRVQFNEMRLVDGNRITRMTLSEGTAIFYANLARNDEFTVVTPGMQVSVPRNSRFRMDVTEKHVNVAVLKGDVTVETQAGNYKLAKGQALLFDTRGAENAIVARAGEPDEFDRWAADRDDAINTSRTASLNYVSAPFRYGVSDLSRHGSWVYAAPYGYVWQPWGISAGWSPYFDGRWIFVAGYGWSWVSHEPWGWLPYHYGSWAYLRSGWAWVPGSLHHLGWHPGLVVWINIGGGRHGWCPRSPFDRPGRIYHNVNVHNTVIVNTATGIIGGGRHQRLDRPRDVRFAGEGGPRERDYFGDVNQIRRGFGGRATTAGTQGDIDTGGERPTGRFGGSRKIEPAERPSGVPAGAAADAERGFSGRADGHNRRFDEQTTRTDGRTEQLGGQQDRTGERLPETRGFSGRSSEQLRPRGLENDGADRRQPRFGDPNNTVEYDPQGRRYENQPATRPPDERSREDQGESRRGFGGRRDADAPPRATPRNEDSSGRGGFGGQRPSNDEPRGRAPEPRSEPRYDRNDSGSRGGWGGRSDSPRPSTPPSPPPRMESPRPSPPPSSSGGGFGGRPSSQPPPPPPPSRGEGPRRPPH